MNDDISYLRQKIDETDSRLLPLFIERMEVAEKVAEYKIKRNIPVLDSLREREVIENRVSLLSDNKWESEVREFFSGIMSISRGAQSKRFLDGNTTGGVIKGVLKEKKTDKSDSFKVVYQGDEGAYSEEALIGYFGEERERFNVLTFEEVFEAIEDGRANFGVLPVENSSTGAISDILDLLTRYNFYIVGEHELEIKHCLLGLKGAKIEDIRKVYSHEQGIMQCREFLKKHSEIEAIPYYNTAVSAKMVSESGDISLAAIAGRRNAKVYGLNVICEDINFNVMNTTRFIIVSKCPRICESSDKISIMFSLKHESGTLNEVISCFAKGGLNLLKIESRPKIGKNFEYIFFVDYDGNILDEQVRKITEMIAAHCIEFKFLGNYKSAKKP